MLATSAPLPSCLPPDAPFTRAEALARGVAPWTLERLAERGVVRRVLSSVYVADAVAESLALRVDALRLVVPGDAVVVDETAGWLHDAARILAPRPRPETPPVHVFSTTPGSRLRHGVIVSGERRVLACDVRRSDGLAVTTPLRAAGDLARLRHRDRAIAALDSLLALGELTLDDLVHETRRFAGMRGVRQLRALAPLADPRAESPPESVLRLRWLDAGIPAPHPQWPVRTPSGACLRLDLALPAVLLAAEHDGAELHSLRVDCEHDAARRAWLAAQGWTVVVVRREHLTGPYQPVEEMLRAGYELALRRHRGRAC